MREKRLWRLMIANASSLARGVVCVCVCVCELKCASNPISTDVCIDQRVVWGHWCGCWWWNAERYHTGNQRQQQRHRYDVGDPEPSPERQRGTRHSGDGWTERRIDRTGSRGFRSASECYVISLIPLTDLLVVRLWTELHLKRYGSIDSWLVRLSRFS